MSAWLALVLADAVAVTSMARCFTGPGELAVALVSLFAVHACTLLAVRGRGSGDRRALWWLVAAAVAFAVPIAWVFAPTLTYGLPLARTWHAFGLAASRAWPVYEHRLAPVPELPGLVVCTGWAAGALAFVASALAADRFFPRFVALVPALGVYLFASTLGTPGWRVPGLALEAGAAVWFLAASAEERDATLDIVVATLDGSPDDAAAGSRTGARGRRSAEGRRRVAPWRLAALAALAAAVIGPNLPGANSAALVAWRGGGPAAAAGGGGPGGPTGPGVQISTLVQVAQEELNNTSTLLFTVHSDTVTREVIATLDDFDGNAWSSSRGLDGSSDRSTAVPTFPTNLRNDRVAPPQIVARVGSTETVITQEVQVYALGGYSIPAPTNTVAVTGAGLVSRLGTGSDLFSTTALRHGSQYALVADLPNPTAAALERVRFGTLDGGSLAPGIQPDLALPRPVPPALVALAHGIVAGATTPYEEARDLQAYFLSGKFHYKIPTRTQTGQVAVPSPGYGGLLRFLDTTRTGYCQQFATAFAVLARIDGLPTRIAVGFLPGIRASATSWIVTGEQTHAWPQVEFGRYGWVDFEPTPGAVTTGTQGVPVLPTGPTTGHHPAGHHPQPPAHNFGHAPQGGGAATVAPPTPTTHHHVASGRVRVPVLQIAIVLVLCWLIAVPSWRALRRRSSGTDPRRGVLRAWRDAAEALDLAGIHRRRAETYLELARRVTTAGVLTSEGEAALGRLAGLATAACYSAHPVGPEVQRAAVAAAGDVRRGARRSVSRWRRALAMLDPRGLGSA